MSSARNHLVLWAAGSLTLAVGLAPANAGTLRVDRSVSTCKHDCDGSDWKASYVYQYLQDALLDAQAGDQIWIAAGTEFEYFPHEQYCDSDVECPGGSCVDEVCSGGSNDGNACDPDLECRDGTCSSNVCSFTSPREKTFNISVVPVKIYGGFYDCGTASNCDDLSDRTKKCYNGSSFGATCTSTPTICSEGEVCVSFYETILSGDIGDPPDDETDCDDCDGMDDECAGNRCLKGDNSYHVVTYERDHSSPFTITPAIDGLVIEAGKADDTGAPDNQGGAVQIRGYLCDGGTNDGEPCLSHDDCPGVTDACELEFCVAGGPAISNCVIRENYASAHAAVNDHAASTDVDESMFQDNRAGAQGGALLVDNGNAQISNSVFIDNKVSEASGEGGAIWFGSRSGTGAPCPSSTNKPKIEDSAVWDNESTLRGGAVFIEDAGTEANPVTISDCTFRRNKTGGAGWGVAISTAGSSSTEVLIERCEFTGNAIGSVAPYGTVSSEGTNVTITDSAFIGNKPARGALIFIQDSSDINIVNCTAAENQVSQPDEGGVIAIHPLATPTGFDVTNSVFYANQGDQITPGEEDHVTITYSLTSECGEGNFNENPKFVNYDDDPPQTPAQALCTSDDVDGDCLDVRLHGDDSPCVDAGDNSVASSSDLDENDRTGGTNSRVDLGAYEHQTPADPCNTECCVDTDCTASSYHDCCRNYSTNENECELASCCDNEECCDGKICCDRSDDDPDKGNECQVCCVNGDCNESICCDPDGALELGCYICCLDSDCTGDDFCCFTGGVSVCQGCCDGGDCAAEEFCCDPAGPDPKDCYECCRNANCGAGETCNSTTHMCEGGGS